MRERAATHRRLLQAARQRNNQIPAEREGKRQGGVLRRPSPLALLPIPTQRCTREETRSKSRAKTVRSRLRAKKRSWPPHAQQEASIQRRHKVYRGGRVKLHTTASTLLSFLQFHDLGPRVDRRAFMPHRGRHQQMPGFMLTKHRALLYPPRSLLHHPGWVQDCRRHHYHQEDQGTGHLPLHRPLHPRRPL